MAKKTKKAPRRATLVRLDEEVYRAVKLRSASTGVTVSDQIDAALRRSLKEDERHLAIFRERKGGPTISYEDFLAHMKRRGLL